MAANSRLSAALLEPVTGSWIVGVGGTLSLKTTPREGVVSAFGSAELAKAESGGEPAEPASAASALGNNADFVSTPPVAVSEVPAQGTVKSWHLRSVGRELLKAHGISRRMRWCGSKISGRADGVSVFARPDRAYGRVAGVCVCGQSVCCPVCAPRIAARRSGEVAEAYNRAMNAGWEARLETFTKPHVLDARPNALLVEFDKFTKIWRHYQNHACRRDRGAEGHHLGREINWGAHGWHYHHHRLRYDRPGTFEPHRERAAWLAALESAGMRSAGADEHAYRCDEVSNEAGARYCAKLALAVDAEARAIGSELASSVTKGRNINALLADHVRGDLQAGAVWINGVSAVTARKVASVRWSRNLRYKLGLDDDAKTDEEIAQEEVTPTDQLLGALNPWQWQSLIRLRAEFALLCAANQGLDAVNSMLSGLNLGQLNDADPRALWAQTNKAD